MGVAVPWCWQASVTHRNPAAYESERLFMPPAEVMPTPSSQIFFPGVYVFTTCVRDKSKQNYSGEPVI